MGAAEGRPGEGGEVVAGQGRTGHGGSPRGMGLNRGFSQPARPGRQRFTGHRAPPRTHPARGAVFLLIRSGM
ncbi:hypothetical protein SGLAM104S_04604 [Streptomyces glaucescens]